MKSGVDLIGEKRIEAQFQGNREEKFQSIVHRPLMCWSNNFERVGDVESSKEAWDILEKAYVGNEKVKKLMLQTHKRQYGLLQLEEKEGLDELFTRVVTLVT